MNNLGLGKVLRFNHKFPSKLSQRSMFPCRSFIKSKATNIFDLKSSDHKNERKVILLIPIPSYYLFIYFIQTRKARFLSFIQNHNRNKLWSIQAKIWEKVKCLIRKKNSICVYILNKKRANVILIISPWLGPYPVVDVSTHATMRGSSKGKIKTPYFLIYILQ